MEDREKMLQDIKDNLENGKIVLMTIDGVITVKLEDIVKQPAECLLYDLNRDLATLFTQAQTSKSYRFVNDIACANVIKYLMERNKDLETKISILEKNDNKCSRNFNNQTNSTSNKANNMQEGFNTSLEIRM